MKTFTLTDPTHGAIAYRDRKRHLWLASLFFPLVALGGIGGYALGGGELALLAPLVAIYGGATLLDWLLGEDRSNPPEALVPQLERHSDHHANPMRRYQSLRSFPDLPTLPSEYFGMFLVALVPPLWYVMMNRRLLALPHVRGDFSRINVEPRRRTSLEARYSTVVS